MFTPEQFQDKFGAVPAQSALVLLDGAVNEAILFKKGCVGTEALFMGGLREHQTAEVFGSLGVELYGARVALEKILGMGNANIINNLPLTPGAEKVLLDSSKRVEALGLYAVRSVDIVATLVISNIGVAGSMFEAFHIGAPEIKSAIATSSIEFV